VQHGGQIARRVQECAGVAAEAERRVEDAYRGTGLLLTAGGLFGLLIVFFGR